MLGAVTWLTTTGLLCTVAGRARRRSDRGPVRMHKGSRGCAVCKRTTPRGSTHATRPSAPARQRASADLNPALIRRRSHAAAWPWPWPWPCPRLGGGGRARGEMVEGEGWRGGVGCLGMLAARIGSCTVYGAASETHRAASQPSLEVSVRPPPEPAKSEVCAALRWPLSAALACPVPQSTSLGQTLTTPAQDPGQPGQPCSQAPGPRIRAPGGRSEQCARHAAAGSGSASASQPSQRIQSTPHSPPLPSTHPSSAARTLSFLRPASRTTPRPPTSRLGHPSILASIHPPSPSFRVPPPGPSFPPSTKSFVLSPPDRHTSQSAQPSPTSLACLPAVDLPSGLESRRRPHQLQT